MQVELLIPQLQFLDDEGAQGELWELSRIFVDTLIEETGCEVSNAIYWFFCNTVMVSFCGITGPMYMRVEQNIHVLCFCILDVVRNSMRTQKSMKELKRLT